MSEEIGRFGGKVALVTGAGTGIGAAVVRRLADEGARVVLTGRRTGPLRETAAPLGDRAVVVDGDAADRAAAERAVETALDRFGRLDVLVANAGGHRPGTVLGVDDEACAYTLRTNLNTAFVTA